VLGAMLLCLSGAGLLMSILARRTPAAVVLVVLLLAVFHLGGLLLEFAHQLCVEFGWYSRVSPHMLALKGMADAWLDANPYRRLFLVLGTFYTDGWIPSGLLPMLVPALLFFALSIPAFVRLAGNLSEGEGRVRKPKATSDAARTRAPLAWPVYWKDNRWRTARPWMAWMYPLFLATAFGLMRWIQLGVADADTRDYFSRDDALFATGLATACGAGVLFVLRGGLFWSTTFAQEIRDETFGALVALPGGLDQVVKQKSAAVMRGLAPDAVLFLVGLDHCMVEIMVELQHPYWGSDDWFLLVSLIFGGLYAILLFWSLCLRFSLVLKRTAVLAALALMGAAGFILVLFMDTLRINNELEAGWTFAVTGGICLLLACLQFLGTVHRLGEAAGD
jgi:hypothetical protein